MPTKTVIYSHCTDNALLENRTGEITSSMYMTLIGDIVGNCSNLGNGALLTINGYALGVIWGRNCFSCLTCIVKKAGVISVKMVLQFY